MWLSGTRGNSLVPGRGYVTILSRERGIAEKLSKATFALKEYIDGKSVELFDIRSVIERIAELDKAFPDDIRKSLLQVAMQGKLTTYEDGDSSVEDYLNANDIVINSTGHGTLGRIGYIEEGLLAGDKKEVPDTHVTVIRVKEGILPQYIFAFLRKNQTYLESKGVGSTKQTELRPDTIKELIVPLPSIEEQMRIVKRINETLPLVEVNLEGDE